MITHRAAPNKVAKLIGGVLFFCLITNFAYAANSAPKLGTITPSSGTSQPNQEVIFTATYIDPDGWKNLNINYFLINTSINGENCFFGYYNQNQNKLYMRNNDNTAWLGGYTPGSANIIENSYAKLNCSKTIVTGSGTTLTVKWAVTFKAAFSGKTYNMYLYAKDDAGAVAAWTKKGTRTVSQILSILIDPKLWDLGSTEVSKTVTMSPVNKITVTNDGTGQETFELALINPPAPGWTSSDTPGKEIYVLNGLFCNIADIPQENSFNQDGVNEDVISIEVKPATQTIFGYSQSTANGVSVPPVPPDNKRSLYLQFKSPTITEKTEQEISVIVSCKTP